VKTVYSAIIAMTMTILTLFLPLFALKTPRERPPIKSVNILTLANVKKIAALLTRTRRERFIGGRFERFASFFFKMINDKAGNTHTVIRRHTAFLYFLFFAYLY